MATFKRLKREPKKRVELSSDILSWISDLERWKTDRKEIEERIEMAEATILSSLGDAESGDLPDGRQVTFYSQHRKAYSVEAKDYRVMRIAKCKAK